MKKKMRNTFSIERIELREKGTSWKTFTCWAGSNAFSQSTCTLNFACPSLTWTSLTLPCYTHFYGDVTELLLLNAEKKWLWKEKTKERRNSNWTAVFFQLQMYKKQPWSAIDLHVWLKMCCFVRVQLFCKKVRALQKRSKDEGVDPCFDIIMILSLTFSGTKMNPRIPASCFFPARR